MTYGYNNGNRVIIHPITNEWVYENTMTSPDLGKKICPKCGKLPTIEGHDACLGTLKGVKFACCGHGIKDRGYIYTNGGIRLTLTKKLLKEVKK